MFTQMENWNKRNKTQWHLIVYWPEWSVLCVLVFLCFFAIFLINNTCILWYTSSCRENGYVQKEYKLIILYCCTSTVIHSAYGFFAEDIMFSSCVHIWLILCWGHYVSNCVSQFIISSSVCKSITQLCSLYGAVIFVFMSISIILV